MYCGSYYNQVFCPAIGSNTAVVVALLPKNTLPHSEMVYVCLLPDMSDLWEPSHN